MSIEAFKRIIELAMMYQDEGPGEFFRRNEEVYYWDIVTTVQRCRSAWQKDRPDTLATTVCCGEIDLLVCPESPYRTEIERQADMAAIQEYLDSDEVKGLDDVSARIVRNHAALRGHADDYEDFIQYVRHFLPEHLASIPRLNFFGEVFGECVGEVVSVARKIETSARLRAEQLGHRVMLREDGTEANAPEQDDRSFQYLVWLSMQWQIREYWEHLFHTRSACDGAYSEIPNEVKSAYWNAAGRIDEICQKTEPTLESRRSSCATIDDFIRMSDVRLRKALIFYEELRIASVKFGDFEKYVRRHVPEMLENVPVVDDFVKDWDLDLFKVCNGIRAVEVAVRRRAEELGITIHAESPERPVTQHLADTTRPEQQNGRIAETVEELPPTQSVTDEPRTDDKKSDDLPFGLMRDDHFQKILRTDYRTPISLNQDEWNLFLLLCKFHPGAVPRNELNRLYQDDKSARENTPKRLRDKLITIGLTVKAFSLVTK